MAAMYDYQESYEHMYGGVPMTDNSWMMWGQYCYQSYWQMQLETLLEKCRRNEELDESELLSYVQGNVLTFAEDPQLCRLVQEAVKKSKSAASAVAQELHLRGSVFKAATSFHGNHVVQEIIKQLPHEKIGFIIDEIQPKRFQYARDKCACRVINRLLEQFGDSKPKTQALIDSLLESVDVLVKDGNGHFVICVALGNGTVEQKKRIMEKLKANLNDFVKHRQASYVLKDAMLLCNGAEQEIAKLSKEINQELIDREDLVELAKHKHGHIVVRTLLSLPQYQSIMQDRLHPYKEDLARNKHGKLVHDMLDRGNASSDVEDSASDEER